MKQVNMDERVKIIQECAEISNQIHILENSLHHAKPFKSRLKRKPQFTQADEKRIKFKNRTKNIILGCSIALIAFFAYSIFWTSWVELLNTPTSFKFLQRTLGHRFYENDFWAILLYNVTPLVMLLIIGTIIFFIIHPKVKPKIIAAKAAVDTENAAIDAENAAIDAENVKIAEYNNSLEINNSPILAQIKSLKEKRDELEAKL